MVTSKVYRLLCTCKHAILQFSYPVSKRIYALKPLRSAEKFKVFINLVLPDFQKGIAFWRVSFLYTWVLLVKVTCTNTMSERLRWSRGSVLAFGNQVRGFKPGRSRRIFQGEKILSTPSFGGEVKPSVPCRRSTACKRYLNATWKSGISGKIHRPFLAHIETTSGESWNA